MRSEDAAESQRRLNAIILKLRKEHPTESEAQLADRLQQLAKEDHVLLTDLVCTMLDAVSREWYDEAAREGREIAEFLKKPS